MIPDFDQDISPVPEYVLEAWRERFRQEISRQFQLPKIKPHTSMTEADAVAEIVRKAQTPEFRPNAQADEVIVFPDKTIVSLEKHAERPRRKRAKVKLADAASFAAYVKQHAQPGTTIFGSATLTGGSFVAVIDGHEGAAEGKPNWGEHRASFELGRTPEWERWIKQNEQPLSQLGFAEFLEDLKADILEPKAIDLLQMASTLQMKNTVAFDSSVRLSNGQLQLAYRETIEQAAGATGTMAVPSEFTLALQPFANGDRYQITARLRTKLENRAVRFTYLLDRPHRIVDDAFKALRALIEKETGLPVLLGSVESIGL